MRYRYVVQPQPHLVIDEIVPRSTYDAMRFPDELVRSGASWGITSSDSEYAAVLEDPAWRALHDLLRGESFVRAVLRAFADDMRAANCLVDPERARLVPFVESREEKERAVLSTDADPNEIYTRLDFQSKGEGGYRDFVHLDWARRIVGGILFFSDAAEEGLEGGELAFYRDRAFRNDRWCHDAELTMLIPPRHNSGAIFLNSNTAFHGPRAIRALRGRRRWLYYTISSRVDVWPCAPRLTAQPRSAAG
ncbi:MAG TPA: 2OG-Fe(II) oxygenase [Thermoanaerobaculia bacterium]|nr:2OG-Fe(II) oxygenase [Thermoanaerobaculia bacterium]